MAKPTAAEIRVQREFEIYLETSKQLLSSVENIPCCLIFLIYKDLGFPKTEILKEYKLP